MSEQIQKDLSELKDSLKTMSTAMTELTHQVTRVVVSNERRDADQTRMAHEIDTLEKKVENIDSVKIPALGNTVSANRQIVVIMAAVITAFSTGAIGMFFRMAAQ